MQEMRACFELEAEKIKAKVGYYGRVPFCDVNNQSAIRGNMTSR